MLVAEKQCLYTRLKDAKSHINEAISVFRELEGDQEVPADIRDKVGRIANALGIDIKEVTMMKEYIQRHD